MISRPFGLLQAVAMKTRLDQGVKALMTTRIVTQFVAQIGALHRLRGSGLRPGSYRIRLCPLPALVCLAGWIHIFVTSGWKCVAGGRLTLLAGWLVLLIWRGYQGASPDFGAR